MRTILDGPMGTELAARGVPTNTPRWSAEAIDRAQLSEAVGSIAGDDTILVIARGTRPAAALVKRDDSKLILRIAGFKQAAPTTRCECHTHNTMSLNL